jgi:hypothetical protein
MDDYASSPLTPQLKAGSVSPSRKPKKKDDFLFPRIDVLVDKTAGHGMLSLDISADQDGRRRSRENSVYRHIR